MSKSFTLSDLADRVGGQLRGPADLKIHGVSAFEEPRQGTLTFIEQEDQALELRSDRVGAAITPLDVDCPCPAIRVSKPRLAFATILNLFYPPRKRAPGIHPTAFIDPSALVDPLAHIGPYCVVGPRCLVDAGACLVGRVILGEGTRLHPNVHLESSVKIGVNCEVGSECWFEPHAVVEARTTVGERVYVGAHCILKEGCKIGRGCKIDNRAIVGRDAEVDSHCILVSGSLLAEHARLGSYCVVAAQAIIGPGIVVASAVQVAGWSVVLDDVLNQGIQIAGEPAVPFRQEIKLRAERSRARETYLKLLEYKKRYPPVEK